MIGIAALGHNGWPRAAAFHDALLDEVGNKSLPARPPFAAADWASVIDAMVDVLQTAHVQPWKRVSRARFVQRANALKLHINSLQPQLAAVEAMALIATVGNGHTSLITRDLLAGWLGLGFMAITDGLFVASTSRPLQHLLGAQVLRLGSLNAVQAQAQAQAAQLWPAERPTRASAWAPPLNHRPWPCSTASSNAPAPRSGSSG